VLTLPSFCPPKCPRASKRRSWSACFGADDAIIPPADVEELRAILTRAGKTFDLQAYPGAGHAFFNDTRPDAHRPAAAADAWPRAIAFLKRHLG
jgi:carboxymethylenebutenolidase